MLETDKESPRLDLICPQTMYKLSISFDWDRCREIACDLFESVLEEFDVMTRPAQNVLSPLLAADGIDYESFSCMAVALKGYSTSGIVVAYSDEYAGIEIKPFASLYETLFGIALRNAMQFFGSALPEKCESGEYVSSFITTGPDSVDIDFKKYEDIWRQQAKEDIANMISGDKDNLVLYGVNRRFYLSVKSLKSPAMESWRVDAFYKMFTNCQWTSPRAGIAATLMRKIDGEPEVFVLLDNSESECMIHAGMLIGLKLNNQVKYITGYDFLQRAQWQSWVTRIDMVQGIVKRATPLQFLKFWMSIPFKPVKSFSRQIFVRCNPKQTEGLFGISDWQHIVDSLNRGRAYLRFPYQPGAPAVRSGDMVALYYDVPLGEDRIRGVIAYGMVISTYQDFILMEVWIAINPLSRAMLLKYETLSQLFENYDWIGEWGQLTLKQPDSGKFSDFMNGIIDQFGALPVLIPEENHVDFALRSEVLMSLEDIDSSPWLDDPEIYTMPYDEDIIE